MDRYYIDSGVFLVPMLKSREQSVVAACLGWLRRVADREVQGVTSWLTWDEVTFVAGRAGGGCDHARAAEAGDLLLRLSNLTFLPVDEDIVRSAQGLLSHLWPRDAIHASAALAGAQGRLVTVDRDDFHGSWVALSGLQVVVISEA